jgi:dihydroceramide fatty acyl 2-hydroxylase
MNVALAIAGLFAWTLVEYLLHRFAFHRPNRFFGRRHIAHHARMNEPRLAIAPPLSILGGALVAGALSFSVFGVRGAWLLGGFLVGYAIYEGVHLGIHYRRAQTSVGRALQRHHLAHHQKTPHARYGVTSPVWDVVFGTMDVKPARTQRRRA